ncbi:MAG: nuclear transport factor 2 family protein [Sphingomonadales bacterium]|nr:MAG: nuclear transport factor 2 family protein [Sphingomonadales bacterium]
MTKFLLAALAPAALLLAGATPALASSTPAAGPGALVFSAVRADDVVTRMFVWWNEAMKSPDRLTAEAFGQFFTADAVMRINGTNRVRGLANMAERFRMIRSGLESVQIHTPFVEAFSSPDGSKIFTYHLESAVKDGKPSHSMVMGYVEVKDGKIALVNFLSVEGQPGPGHMAP